MPCRQPGRAWLKASLLALLPPGEQPRQLDALRAAANDPDGLVRLGAARALVAMGSSETLPLGIALLDDPLLSIRMKRHGRWEELIRQC